MTPIPAMKRFWPFLFVISGLSLLFGGLFYFAMVTGFPFVWSAQEAKVFDYYSHLISVTCWFGLGIALWGFVANGCILKQAKSRQLAATSFGVITLLCAIWELGVCAQWYWICHHTFWGGYFFDPASMFFTFPPAVVCTVLSLLLVGPRKCKLAWISLCLFALPLGETFLMIPTWGDYIETKYAA